MRQPHVEAREIANGERAHGHAEIVKRGVNVFHARAFLDQKNGFADIRMEHPVADEAAAVPYQARRFAEFLCKLHAGGNDFLAGGFAADDFEQAHHVRGAEEMRADDGFGPRSCGGDLVNIQRGGVAGENRAGLADAVELAQRPLSSAPCPQRRLR